VIGTALDTSSAARGVRAVDLACDFGVAVAILTFEAQVACG
jgi:hypothetical protein